MTMIACRCPVLLVALTLTTSLIEMGSRGLQLYEEDLPSPHSLSQQFLHSEEQPELRPQNGTSADLSLVIDGSCSDEASGDALRDPDHRKVKSTHNSDTVKHAGRMQVISIARLFFSLYDTYLFGLKVLRRRHSLATLYEDSLQ